jgi:4-amino-4-deoxy-L-arabinose transferase-like glycosyltransferase
MMKRHVNEWIVGILLFYIAFYVVTLPLLTKPEAKIRTDEPAYISGSTKYFKAYFIERDYSSSVWNQWLAYTQPPVTYYLFGAVFFITGHGDKRMGWKFWNDPLEPFFYDLLPIARMTISITAVITILFVYLFGVVVFNLQVGLIAALLTLANPIFRFQARIAYPDIPLLLTMVLTVLLIFFWYKSLKKQKIIQILIHSALIGFVIGICGSTRLNGSLGGFVYAGFCFILTLSLGLRRKPAVLMKKKMFLILLSLFMAVLISSVVFVSLNPFLYPNPIDKTKDMIRHRISEGRNHHRMFPDTALFTLKDRLRTVLYKTFYTQSSFSNPLIHWSFGVVLFLIGILTSIYREIQRLRQNDSPSGESLGLIWFAVYFIGICLYVTMAWNRYYLPFVPIVSLIQSVGLVFLIDQCRKTLVQKFQRLI